MRVTFFKDMKQKLILIDGNSIMHRAFHAIPGMKTSQGELTNAIFGFFSVILSLIEKENPTYMAVAFDKGKNTFRKKEFKEYKAHRPKSPDGLYEQLPKIKMILDAFAIPYYSHANFEADDALGTLAEQAHIKGDLLSIIVTSDMDALQLVRNDVYVASPQGFKNHIYYTPADVIKKMDLNSDQVIDYKGLKGDASDNIPGVKGVGDKTAVALLKEYGNLEGVYENIDKLKGSVKKKLEDNKDMAFMSKKMATIVRDGPFKLDLNECKTRDKVDNEKVLEIFEDFELGSLIRRFKALFEGEGEVVEPERKKGAAPKQEKKENMQISLF